jgi:hypothetical protein
MVQMVQMPTAIEFEWCKRGASIVQQNYFGTFNQINYIFAKC